MVFFAVFDVTDKHRYILCFCFGILDLVAGFNLIWVNDFIRVDFGCLTSNMRWQSSGSGPLLPFYYFLLDPAYCGFHVGVGVYAFEDSECAEATDNDQ